MDHQFALDVSKACGLVAADFEVVAAAVASDADPGVITAAERVRSALYFLSVGCDPMFQKAFGPGTRIADSDAALAVDDFLKLSAGLQQ